MDGRELALRAAQMSEKATISLDWSQGQLAAGLQCYRDCEFFEAHEHWECIWLGCNEPERTFLQALIQITAAFHHLQRGNHIGTASLLRAALRRLDRYPNEFGGLAVEPVRESVRAWLEALDEGDESPELRFPAIL